MELNKIHSPRTRASESRRQDALIASMREITHAADKHSRYVVKKLGLSSAHIVVLRAIRDLGDGTTRQLSKNVSLSQATVTVLLNKLEQMALVERQRSSTDRRIVHSKLTKAGFALLDRAPPPLPSRFIEAFDALTETRRAEILSAFFDVAQMMGADDYRPAPAAMTEGTAF